jgi:hypothetical protein
MLKFQNTCIQFFAVNAGRILREPIFRSLIHFYGSNYSGELLVSTELRGAYILTIKQLIPLIIHIRI